MSSNEHPLRLPTVGATMDTSGLFGIERGSDGLLRAVGPKGCRAKIGLRDDVALSLALQYQPDSEDLAWMLANDDSAQALNEAFHFPVTWDRMAPGEIVMAFCQDHPEIVTMSLPGVVTVECSEDGLFHIINEFDGGDVSSVGVTAEIAALIIINWEGLNAAADIASEYVDFEFIAKSLVTRWNAEAALYASSLS